MSNTSADVKLPGVESMGTTISYHARFGGGKRKHKAATATLLETNNVTNKKRAGVWVDLYDSAHLESAKKASSVLRNYINSNTLPWGDDGRRFLPNAIKDEVDTYISDMRSTISDHMENHFSSFTDQEKLWNSEGGGLAAYGIDFPSIEDARNKYCIDVVPGVVTKYSDISKRMGGLTQEQRSRFEKDVRAAEEDRVRGTVKNVVGRVEDALVRMVDRLGKYGKNSDGKVVGKFHDTLIENVRDIAGLIEHFNITGDPEIEVIRRRLVNEICPVTPDDLRGDEVLRKDVSSRASDIIGRLGSIGSSRD